MTRMKGFILAHGWSGTTWTAYALNECTDLYARHESMGKALPPVSANYGGVESNGNLWKLSHELRERFCCPVVHLVRDGREVVRTHMARKAHLGRTFEHACRRWAVRNEQLLHDIRSDWRFRLEDLVSSYTAFHGFARTLGATTVNLGPWSRVRHERKNRRPTPHVLGPWDDWTDEQRAMFTEICGPAMEACGYDG